MQGVKLVLADGMWLRCDTDFDLSKVVDVQPARMQGGDATFAMHWDIQPETMQEFLDAMETPENTKSGPEAFYLESE